MSAGNIAIDNGKFTHHSANIGSFARDDPAPRTCRTPRVSSASPASVAALPLAGPSGVEQKICVVGTSTPTGFLAGLPHPTRGGVSFPRKRRGAHPKIRPFHRGLQPSFGRLGRAHLVGNHPNGAPRRQDHGAPTAGTHPAPATVPPARQPHGRALRRAFRQFAGAARRLGLARQRTRRGGLPRRGSQSIPVENPKN